MPIKVVCACGAAFAARDELAGRTVACPKCKQPLTIAAPQAAQPVAAAPHANADLFDGIGLKARDTNLARCPGCAADLIPNAVICVKCGYNLKLGKQMQTIKMSGDAGLATGGGGHGADATAQLMNRAAQMAEEDAIAEKTKTSVGMPLWILVTAGLGCVLFGVVMSVIPQGTALQGTGWIMLVTSFLLVIFAWINISMRAFIKNPLLGFAVLFGDIIVAAIAVALIVFISTDTLPREVTLFSIMLIGACSSGYAFTDPEGCAKFMFYSQVAYVLRCVGLVLLILGWIVGTFSGVDPANPQGNLQRSPPVTISQFA